MKFSKRLKELRLEKEMRQEDIAKMINVSRHAITGYENGKREPSLDKVIALAKFFNVSIDYLLGFSDIKQNIDSRYTFVVKQAELANLKPSDLIQLIEMIQKFQSRKPD